MHRNCRLPSETLFLCRRDSSLTKLPEEGDEVEELEADCEEFDGIGGVAQAICTASKVQRGDCSEILSMAEVLHSNFNVVAMQLLLNQHQITSKEIVLEARAIGNLQVNCEKA